MINLGQYKCRTDERPDLLWPPHLYRTTNPHPYFSWTAITDASNYRVFLFDDKVVANRTVDVRQNSGGPTNLTMTQSLMPDRYFWRVRGRQNRIWSLWSVRFTLFVDPVVFAPDGQDATPVPPVGPAPTLQPTIGVPPNDEVTPVATPTLPAPPNSR